MGKPHVFLAICVLQNYIEWRKTKPYYYFPRTAIKKIKPADDIQEVLDYIKQSNPDYSDKHLIMKKFSEFMKANEEKASSPYCLTQ